MPVHLPPAPPDAVKALQTSLASALAEPEGSNHVRAIADAAPVDLSPLHPVFTASALDILGGRLLAAARQTGWRTIVSKDGAPIGAAEIDNANVLSNVSEGPFVGGTVDAVHAAEGRFAGEARDYELRLLRIPAMYLVAIWLHADDSDVLVPAAPAPAPLRANEAIDAAAFVAALRPLAETRLTS